MMVINEDLRMRGRVGQWLVLLAIVVAIAGCSKASSDESAAKEILTDLVVARTAPSGGNDTRAAVAGLVARLQLAGFDDDEIFDVGQTEKLRNLVVRYRSRQPRAEPILMMAHLDVVEALREDWTVEPFQLTEADGYYYGRGTTDNLAGAAVLVANFIRLRKEGFEPERDLIVMLTADEETTGDAATWLTAERRDLIDAEFALNTDAGLVMLKDDEARAFIMQTSEKVYVSYRLEALDPGGHSSLPRADNAIARLARTIVALHQHEFPIDLNETTREFFNKWQAFASPADRDLIRGVLEGGAGVLPKLERSPYYNALARTTCVATQLEGGHAENALPQSAKAVINCRVLPQTPPDSVTALISEFAESNDVSVTQIYDARPSPPSPLDPAVIETVTAVAHQLWPGIPLIPEMSTGATDGLFVRNAGIPVYGVSGIAEDPDDIRAHGQDERIRIESFRDSTEFWYLLMKKVSTSE